MEWDGEAFFPTSVHVSTCLADGAGWCVAKICGNSRRKYLKMRKFRTVINIKSYNKMCQYRSYTAMKYKNGNITIEKNMNRKWRGSEGTYLNWRSRFEETLKKYRSSLPPKI
jgi:hypothetical protein